MNVFLQLACALQHNISSIFHAFNLKFFTKLLQQIINMPTNFDLPKSKAYPVMLHLILKPPKK